MTEKTEKNVVLAGDVVEFKVPAVTANDQPWTRLFALMTSPFGEFRRFARPYLYQEGAKKGEQRCQGDSHVKTLRKALGSGEFTPTTLSVGLYERHVKLLEIEDGRFKLPLDVSKKDGMLPVTDGGHRLAGLERLRAEAEEAWKDAKDDEKGELASILAQVDAIPIPYVLHLKGGDTQLDFVRLQLGRAVDRTHMLALTLKKGGDAGLLAAKAVAEELNKTPGTFFHNIIRFSDTKKTAFKTVPFNSFCQAGASDLSFSLVGMAKVGAAKGIEPAGLASLVATAVRWLNTDEDFAADDEYGEMTSEDRVLTPLDVDGGSLGAATLYIGTATCLAYLLGEGWKEPTMEDRFDFINAAKAELNRAVNGGMDGARKRKLMGAFARELFSGVTEEKVGGVPYGLLACLGSASAYGVDADEWKRAKGERKAAEKEEAKAAKEALAAKEAKEEGEAAAKLAGEPEEKPAGKKTGKKTKVEPVLENEPALAV